MKLRIVDPESLGKQQRSMTQGAGMAVSVWTKGSLRTMALLVVIALSAACGASFEAARTLERGDYQKAADMYRAVLDADQTAWLDRMNYGRALLGLGDTQAARGELERATSDSTGRWEPAYWLGASYLLEGRAETGVAVMNERMSPDSVFMKRDLISGALRAVELDADRAGRMQALKDAAREAENREQRRKSALSQD